MGINMLTRDSLTTLISRNDEIAMHAIGRALVHLLNRQTKEEANSNTTTNLNSRGFAPADAKKGCISAKFYLKHRKLEDWQMKIWLERNKNGVPRLSKYWAQLDEEAKAKQKAVN